MDQPTLPALDSGPGALVAYQRTEGEQVAGMEARWGSRWRETAPEDHRLAHGVALAEAFTQMYVQLTPAERQAASGRVPGWDLQVDVAKSDLTYKLTVKANERSRAEIRASTAAEASLKNCSYLGGFSAYPKSVARCSGSAHISYMGHLQWVDRTGAFVCGAGWLDIESITVSSTDRAQERVTAPRAAAFGVFALGAKKQRREAKLAVKTNTGEGIFIVKGQTLSELQAQLAPLSACVGEKPSDWAHKESGLPLDELLAAQGTFDKQRAQEEARHEWDRIKQLTGPPKLDFTCAQCSKALFTHLNVGSHKNVSCPDCGCSMDVALLFDHGEFKKQIKLLARGASSP